MTNRFTERAQRALNASLSAAADLGHTYIGSEHILLGLMADDASIAAKMLCKPIRSFAIGMEKKTINRKKQEAISEIEKLNEDIRNKQNRIVQMQDEIREIGRAHV